ncbi:hypothetical protein C8Q80DRAFT_1275233 [Daedaleopsis nitida]|nr:hypothetical protein C8Q80DRAFT_1275233 [Daedaleopsis nitida]
MSSAIPTEWIVTSTGWTPLALLASDTSTDTPGAGPSTPTSATTSPVTQDAPTPAHAAQNAHKRKRRLPEEAYYMLREFYINVTAYPKKPDRIQLAERIRQLPGCDDYTEQQVAQYFAGRRQGDRGRTQQAASRVGGSLTSAHILYPSLVRDPKILKMLDVLLLEMPEPTLDVAVIWAERIGWGAKAADIVTYANLRHAQKGQALAAVPANGSNPSTANTADGSRSALATAPAASQATRTLSWQLPIAPNPSASGALALPRLPPFQRSPPPSVQPPRALSHLPTPASSKSPEPRSPVVGKTVPSKLAVVDQLEDEDEDMKDQLMDTSDEEMEGEGEVVPEASSSYQTHADAIATELRDALSKPLEYPAGGVPKTYAEFSRWMSQNPAPSIFLGNIKSGKYAHIGMGPDIASKPP